jgi:hypothetical protein
LKRRSGKILGEENGMKPLYEQTWFINSVNWLREHSTFFEKYIWGKFLTERSVLDPTVLVANGAQLTVTYEISMDFSSID